MFGAIVYSALSFMNMDAHTAVIIVIVTVIILGVVGPSVRKDISTDDVTLGARN